MRNLCMGYGKQGEKQKEIRELYNAAFPPPEEKPVTP